MNCTRGNRWKSQTIAFLIEVIPDSKKKKKTGGKPLIFGEEVIKSFLGGSRFKKKKGNPERNPSSNKSNNKKKVKINMPIPK